VRPKLRQGTFLSADSEFSLYNAQLCVTGLMSRELFVKTVLVIEMIAVAQHDHPLLSIRRRLSRSDLMQHMLVTIEARHPEAGSSSRSFPRSAFFPLEQYNRRSQRFEAGFVSAGCRSVTSSPSSKGVILLCFRCLPATRAMSG
jgi:hypothetical protein